MALFGVTELCEGLMQRIQNSYVSTYRQKILHTNEGFYFSDFPNVWWALTYLAPFFCDSLKVFPEPKFVY